jgi:ubiquitin-like 1-activating enzyme E1 A
VYRLKGSLGGSLTKKEVRKDVMETVVIQKTEDFLDLSTAVDRLLTESKRKRNPLIYFYLLLWVFKDQQEEGLELDRIACREFIAQRLVELGIIYDTTLLDVFLKQHDTELAPVAAIIGGIAAQEVLKILSGKELPIQSFLVYNALDQSNSIENPSPSSSSSSS